METKLEPRRLWKKRLNPTARKLANLTDIQIYALLFAGAGAGISAIVTGSWMWQTVLTPLQTLFAGLALYISSIAVLHFTIPKLRPLRLRERQWIEAQGTLDTFTADTKAVSPVLVMILMVAITVVLTATIFVLLSSLGAK